MDKRFKILAVDDEPHNLKLISSALKGRYEILTAMDGHDAIRQVEDYMPDLILLDVMMPEISGFDVCTAIKANPLFADIPVIFLTAMDTHEGARQGLDIGGIDYLTKPVDIELLRLRVSNHLESKNRNDLLKENMALLVQKNEELEAALARVRQLEGIIPICSYCKKIRDDNNSWQKLETYISQHTEALFSHGMCPDCFEVQMEVIRNMK